MAIKKLALYTVMATTILLAACSNDEIAKNDNKNDVKVKQEQEQQDKEAVKQEKQSKQGEENISSEKNNEAKKDESDIDLTLKPNESGEIMVLMYHSITTGKESEWARTTENFKKDLKVLYEKGYRPISLTDFVNNNITTPAGYTPVVLTFDDGLQNNLNIIEKDGKKTVDPNCAVGILEAFNKEHPDFPLEATFFVYGSNPFRQKDLVKYKLNYIVNKGMDIGNHTVSHNDMSKKSNQNVKAIQEYIGKEAQFLESMIDSDYKINTYALCNGARPMKDLQPLLEKGSYKGFEYHNIAILNVGARPSVSPIDKNFNPMSIKRVRASETNVGRFGLYAYLEMFDKYPQKRFISDGVADIVTVNKKNENKIDKQKIGDKKLYIYE
ncbi:polysaccharide deacetylase family protein [Clostridiaceae bacterium M8S5]|nr:polysaccharide deacetylase family protein [Clostridiaceae bacterium M8S5]